MKYGFRFFAMLIQFLSGIVTKYMNIRHKMLQSWDKLQRFIFGDGHFWCCALNSNTLLLITKLYRCTLVSVFTVSVFISFGFCVFDIHSNRVIFISIIGSSMPFVFIFFLKFSRIIIIMNIILCKFTLHRYLLFSFCSVKNF